MTDPDQERRARQDRSMSRMSWIVMILAALVVLLGIIYNGPAAPAPSDTIDTTPRSN